MGSMLCISLYELRSGSNTTNLGAFQVKDKTFLKFNVIVRSLGTRQPKCEPGKDLPRVWGSEWSKVLNKTERSQVCSQPWVILKKTCQGVEALSSLPVSSTSGFLAVSAAAVALLAAGRTGCPRTGCPPASCRTFSSHKSGTKMFQLPILSHRFMSPPEKFGVGCCRHRRRRRRRVHRARSKIHSQQFFCLDRHPIQTDHSKISAWIIRLPGSEVLPKAHKLSVLGQHP